MHCGKIDDGVIAMRSMKIATKMTIMLLIVCLALAGLSAQAIYALHNSKETMMHSFESEMRSEYDERIQNHVENAVSMLNGVYVSGMRSGYTQTQMEYIGAGVLREMRYGTDGYFWADTFEGLNKVLLGSATEGTNRIGAVDANGYPMVENIIRNGRQPDGGYTDYMFPKEGSTEPMAKRSYSKAFEPFGWVIGTGNYTDSIDEAVAAQRTLIETQQQTAIRTLYIVSAAFLLVSALLTALVARSVVQPIRKLTQVTDRLAAGELDTDIDIHTKEETGRLAASLRSLITQLHTYIAYIDETADAIAKIGGGDLNVDLRLEYNGDFAKLKTALLQTRDMLNDALRQIDRTAVRVKEGAIQLSGGAQELSQGASQQAASVQELAAALAGLSGRVQENAAAANAARGHAEQMQAAVQRGGEDMRGMTQAMERISAKSQEIVKTIHVIDDIASQTNILALNASVEAARAGAAGKGFAVVAEEVRNLAAKSAAAAKRTGDLVEESANAVREGVRIVQTTDEAFRALVTDARQTAGLVVEIASASAKQAETVQQVSLGIEQIAGVVQNTSATAQQSAAASEQLLGQAELLHRLVARFRLTQEAEQ